MKIKTNVVGFPRIGEKRELKKVLEGYWAGKYSQIELERISKELRIRHLTYQKDSGIDLISVNDFSWYDGMLDTAIMVNAIPKRFLGIDDQMDRYFAMARGNKECLAMGMTKWFNTNYHYIVPELSFNDQYRLNLSKIIQEYKEARKLAIKPKINVIGPITFLALSQRVDNGQSPLDLFDNLLPVYEELIIKLSKLDDEVFVQFDESYFSKDVTENELSLLRKAYTRLTGHSKNVNIMVTTYFNHSQEATSVLAKIPVWGIGLDFVQGKKNLEGIHCLQDQKLIAGIVDGRNIWRANLLERVQFLKKIANSVKKENIIVSSSCSLLHVPYSLEYENKLNSQIKSWLSFALEKLEEISLISKLFFEVKLTKEEEEKVGENIEAVESRQRSTMIHNPQVQNRLDNLVKRERVATFEERIKIQKAILKYPRLPTTTIGSFPQTKEIRKLRRDFKNNKITADHYKKGIKEYIKDCIAFQEKIGLDILVHGEPERNDMVEYFGEMLEGFCFTANGWVQSYGSRCVKPPIIYGDVSRPQPMTVEWITYGQSLTKKNVKGMLTGAVTMLNWSFVRDDLPRSSVSDQIAVALSDEVNDLQNAGIKIIQVDEAAFKEGYPLRKDEIPQYETWAVRGFKLTVSTAKKETQIHTHMCYSQFDDIIKTIEAMDADVISIETARGGNRLLKVFNRAGYKQEVGPGVYDIHSPRVPTVSEMIKQIRALLDVLPQEQLWINPDCGLKTRKWHEVKPSLKNMVDAVKRVKEKNI
jgi:5-methyltetrahydropteroyltriglutamate--homocysteine methyltransferase